MIPMVKASTKGADRTREAEAIVEFIGRALAQEPPEGWDRPSRARSTTAPTEPKVRWERGLTKTTQREVEANRVELTSRAA